MYTIIINEAQRRHIVQSLETHEKEHGYTVKPEATLMDIESVQLLKPMFVGLPEDNDRPRLTHGFTL